MNIRPKQKKKAVRPVHPHSLGDPEWRNLSEVAALHGTTPANVGVAFNSGMSKIAEEVLLQMTGKKPGPEALLQLVKSEEFGLLVAEIMREEALQGP
jgi:hypothetical protein